MNKRIIQEFSNNELLLQTVTEEVEIIDEEYWPNMEFDQSGRFQKCIGDMVHIRKTQKS